MDIHVPLILVHVYILLITPPAKCAIFTVEQEQRITEFVESLMRCKDNPGLTLAVVKGSDSWAKGFGMADLDSGRAVEDDTMFVIGSLGKAFTMTLLGSLLEGTSYSWSTKVAGIEGVNLEFVNDTLTREVTLADLLAHRTGLWDVVDYGFVAGYPEGTTIEVLSSRLKHIPQRYPLRHPIFLYNNAMYMILGHVIEVLGKDTWYNLMTSRILEPLGMTTTKLMSNTDDVLVGNVAKPYIRAKGKVMLNGTTDLYKITPLEPAGGILSSAVDMAKWIRFNLDSGKTTDGRQLVNEELFAEAFKKQRGVPYLAIHKDTRSPPFPVNSLYNGYGYAWFTSTYRGFNRVSHSGGYFSYVSLLWLFPDQDFGLFVNVNGPGRPGTSDVGSHMILFYLADILLGVESWLNTSTACTFPLPWKKTEGFKSLDFPQKTEYTNDKLHDYPGHYGSPVLPDIVIDLSEDGSKLRLLWNRVEGDLIPAADPNGFEFKMTAPWEYVTETQMFGDVFPITIPVQFLRDSGGVVQNLTLTLGDTAIMPFRKGECFAYACKTGSRHAESAEANAGNGVLLGRCLSLFFYVAACFLSLF